MTGIYCESYSGRHSAELMSRTGYDAVVIKGASAQPVYLEISDSKVEFHDTTPIWGKETFESEIFIRKAVNRRRHIQRGFIKHMQSVLADDPKLDELYAMGKRKRHYEMTR